MKKSAIQELFEATDLKVRAYSGRAMYGAQCLGVEVDGLKEIVSAIAYGVNDENRDEITEAIESLQTDSMGFGVIAYFPGTEYVGESDTCDEDEDAA